MLLESVNVASLVMKLVIAALLIYLVLSFDKAARSRNVGLDGGR
jgi:hypothetical protein